MILCAGQASRLRTLSSLPGRQASSFHPVGEMLGFLAEQGLTRSDFLVALGGGVTGDMAGFCRRMLSAGRILRTGSHLAARTGGLLCGAEKRPVDLPQGKNLAGAFHQPALVLIDPDTLDTLPPSSLPTAWAR